MKKSHIWLICPLLGGLVFWGADALINPFARDISTAVWIIVKILLLPLACGFTFWFFVKKTSSQALLMTAAMAMLVGIWFGGPLYYLLFYANTMKTPMGVGEMVIYIVFFPLSTLLVSLFSGSFGGLMVATASLMVLGTGWLGVPGSPRKSAS
ncbi:hypothetical protein [Geobacter sp. AOG1]|uniref:hypothetical protein n=1 Tax=Geobacter sp. AOG1 TaxID=1566346 RepID=UPI001CC47A4E|nr:hypothetical protein [Geobacter sp. AOG1]GFE56550.1 hypothetical protein AOG1_04290 [Geobacter sp. AOG1]